MAIVSGEICITSSAESSAQDYYIMVFNASLILPRLDKFYSKLYLTASCWHYIHNKIPFSRTTPTNRNSEHVILKKMKLHLDTCPLSLPPTAFTTYINPVYSHSFIRAYTTCSGTSTHRSTGVSVYIYNLRTRTQNHNQADTHLNRAP